MKSVATSFVMLAGLVSPARGDEPDVDYLRDVKPLLAKHCVRCHGATKPKASLRVDTAAGLLKGGLSGPAVIAGNVDDSTLVSALLGEGPGDRMPLKKPPLPASEISKIRRWIEAGAKAPADEVPSIPPVHWAFVPPVRRNPPAVKNEDWARNPIDRFVLARLEKQGISPSPEADRTTLIRRASLDIIGLPPTTQDVDSFVKDNRPDAYERMIDRLLASPHYGERWGRLWLDGARYADSNGYSIDAPRIIWPFRDWVINALNRDQPFDQFTIDQLAGDLRPEATLEQKTATGFHRNTPINEEGGIDIEQFRVESILDRVNTTANVWLGLTMGCCQCHDHKYDPLLQSEYYQMFAFFNNCDEINMPVATADQIAKANAVEKDVESYLDKILVDEPSLRDKQRAWEGSLGMDGIQKQSQEVRAAFDVGFAKRNEAQNRAVFAAFVEQDAGMKDHRKAIATIRKEAPKLLTTMVVAERKIARESHRLTQGDFTRPAEKVKPGVPSALPKLSATSESADRMDLARWLVDPSNPLTARVTINRLWQVYFGRGLVETENDFGLQGSLPTHPELLDWLATEFIAQNWSQKAMHRLIATSATYRQSSRSRPDLATIDSDNRLLARQSRVRVDAELVRDVALVASGLLNAKIGGPSVFPPQPDGVMNLGQIRRSWTTSKGDDRYRRGMYTYLWRATPHPLFTIFDAPDGTRACTRRLRSNTPLQALALLNDDAFIECAQALAMRLIAEGKTENERIDEAFFHCLSRKPNDREKERLRSLLAQLKAEGQNDPAAWITVARVLLNLDEFITRE